MPQLKFAPDMCIFLLASFFMTPEVLACFSDSECFYHFLFMCLTCIGECVSVMEKILVMNIKTSMNSQIRLPYAYPHTRMHTYGMDMVDVWSTLRWPWGIWPSRLSYRWPSGQFQGPTKHLCLKVNYKCTWPSGLDDSQGQMILRVASKAYQSFKSKSRFYM